MSFVVRILPTSPSTITPNDEYHPTYSPEPAIQRQSRKSFETEFRTAWLDRLGIAWNGSDLDDRHHTFASRHKEVVRSYQLDNEQESKSALPTLFRRVLKDTAPVHIIDTRAQADALILSALEEMQVLDVCAEENVRLTFFLFPTDDTESMTNLGRLFLAPTSAEHPVTLFHLIPQGDEHEATRSDPVSEEWASYAEFARIVTE